MKINSIRTRVDRLEKKAREEQEENKAQNVCSFAIDPSLARTLRDDYERLRASSWNKDAPRLTDDEIDEIRECIKNNVASIRIPPDYGVNEAAFDQMLLEHFYMIRITPHRSLNPSEDEIEARLRARVLAFDETPAAKELERFKHLDWKVRFERLAGYTVTPAERDEHKRLHQLYGIETPKAYGTDEATEKIAEIVLSKRERFSKLFSGGLFRKSE
jgi:hypothetical protein